MTLDPHGNCIHEPNHHGLPSHHVVSATETAPTRRDGPQRVVAAHTATKALPPARVKLHATVRTKKKNKTTV